MDYSEILIHLVVIYGTTTKGNIINMRLDLHQQSQKYVEQSS